MRRLLKSIQVFKPPSRHFDHEHKIGHISKTMVFPGWRGKSGPNGRSFLLQTVNRRSGVPIFQSRFRKISIFDWRVKFQAEEFRKSVKLDEPVKLKIQAVS
jgi:hypothetical protein